MSGRRTAARERWVVFGYGPDAQWTLPVADEAAGRAELAELAAQCSRASLYRIDARGFWEHRGDNAALMPRDAGEAA